MNLYIKWDNETDKNVVAFIYSSTGINLDGDWFLVSNKNVVNSKIIGDGNVPNYKVISTESCKNPTWRVKATIEVLTQQEIENHPNYIAYQKQLEISNINSTILSNYDNREEIIILTQVIESLLDLIANSANLNEIQTQIPIDIADNRTPVGKWKEYNDVVSSAIAS